ncbi:hypothetical protein BP6252_00282 [Coleophoma cylindrospora]|uniref:DNA ligase ATP-dependent N-terminal domain-containing protein n=1 Tax=Coleophoma cylindrospora TaxID=1849047 RepID=A0A3D8SPK4_9HELO|nr:hypothetical protein BP6252_00282 [Coleophoma cylindrospora]
MPFRFVYICDLLDTLHRIAITPTGPSIIAAVRARRTNEAMVQWFRQHRQRIDANDTDAEAVARALWLGKETGRVYGLDAKLLEQIIARALALPMEKWIELQAWELRHDAGDLAAVLERVLDGSRATVVRAEANAVTIEEIDQTLLLLASQNDQSSLAVRNLAKVCINEDPLEQLGKIYCRLQAREAKWLTRLILKNYGPIEIPEVLDFGAVHSSLPSMFNTRAEMSVSVDAAVRRERTCIVRGSTHGKSRIGAKDILPIPPITASQQSIARSALTPLKPQQLNQRNTPATSLELSTNASPESSPLSSPPILHHHRGTGHCTLTHKICPLANCIFILGPCLSGYPWVTENLLPWHGATFITDYRLSKTFHQFSRPNVISGKKFRKIALVESNRSEQAVQFMHRIEKLDLKRNDGTKDWVEVYDWRLLECIAKTDKGKNLEYNPWKRCWIGCV